jgi:prevent-host-death family protein
MNYVPEIAAISDMRVRSGEIVAAARRGPVILIEKGSRPALIVVSPEQWNQLMERLELLEDTVAVYQTRLNQATGKSKPVPFELADYDLEEITEQNETEGTRVPVVD